MNYTLLYSKISSLPEELQKQVLEFIESLLSKSKKPKKGNQKNPERGYGCMKGQIKMSKDFDKPLDDFKEYMY